MSFAVFQNSNLYKSLINSPAKTNAGRLANAPVTLNENNQLVFNAGLVVPNITVANSSEIINSNQTISTQIPTTVITGGFSHTFDNPNPVDGTTKLVIDAIVRVLSNSISSYNQTTNTFSPLGPGLTNSFQIVFSILTDGTDIYAGGAFTESGTESVPNIGKWNGTSWSSLGVGLNSLVFALAGTGNNLYAGGQFTFLSDFSTNLNKIAKWNGSNWSSLGIGLNDDVTSLLTSGTDLYVGGQFTTLSDGSGTNLKYIAKWDGTSWSSLGIGLNARVNVITLGTELYVGGNFTALSNGSGTNLKYIAKWDGTSWSSLGIGFNSFVRAIYVQGTDIYVGGDFNALSDGSGTGLNFIAKWDTITETWSSLGVGLNGPVYAIHGIGSNLYVGGDFTNLSDESGDGLNYLAKWDTITETWSQVGGGVNGFVRSLNSSGDNLYIGGNFTISGLTQLEINGANFFLNNEQKNVITSETIGRSSQLVYSANLNSWVLTNNATSPFTF